MERNRVIRGHGAPTLTVRLAGLGSLLVFLAAFLRGLAAILYIVEDRMCNSHFFDFLYCLSV